MNDWLADTIVSGSVLLALPVAFVAGLVSFFSPCVLPLLPGYLSYTSGMAVQEFNRSNRRRLILGSVLFVMGFSVIFVLSGALFGSIGRQLAEYQRPLSIITGIVVIVMGLAFIGVIPWLNREVRVRAVPAVGLGAAPLLGIFFGLGWAPCLGPTLTAVLGLSMSLDDASAARGATLAFAYCLGLGIPFIVAAVGLGKLTGTVAWLADHRRQLSIGGGVLMILTGVLLLTGWWNDMVVSMQGWIGGFQTAI